MQQNNQFILKLQNPSNNEFYLFGARRETAQSYKVSAGSGGWGGLASQQNKYLKKPVLLVDHFKQWPQVFFDQVIIITLWVCALVLLDSEP